MSLLYRRHDQICFESAPSDDDNWLRADLYEDVGVHRLAVGIDRGGLYLLDKDGCQQMAAWLLSVADRIPKAEPVAAKVRGKRKASQREPQLAAEPEWSDDAA
jgi:hypothetical protein